MESPTESAATIDAGIIFSMYVQMEEVLCIHVIDGKPIHRV
jgi:hypothetical protein